MAFPAIPDMYTRLEFDVGLRDARHTVGQLLQSDPNDPLYRAISNQLEAIEQWTLGGRNLTQKQKDRVNMGLVAQRELKGDDPDLAALLIGLHNYILQRMPTVGSP
jgi:hypothetical protein